MAVHMIPRWFMFAVIGWMMALTMSLVYLDTQVATSSKQNDTHTLLCDVEGAIKQEAPVGCPADAQRYQQFQREQVNQQGFILYCFNQDAIAAANHHPTAPGCDGTLPPKVP